MRALTIFSVTALLMAGLCFAGTSEELVETTVLAYTKTLESEIAGLRYNAVYQIAKLRSELPDADLGCCEIALIKLIRNEKQPLVRAHAILVLAYIRDVNLHSAVKADNRGDSQEFYNQVTQAMQNDFYRRISEEEFKDSEYITLKNE